MKFYKCDKCNDIFISLNNSPDVAIPELIPGTVDAAKEKHVPVFSVNGEKVTVHVGEVDHPMVDVHFIEWVAIETDKGVQVKYLKPESAPEAVFGLEADEKLVGVYAYCNLHGLWKAEPKK